MVDIVIAPTAQIHAGVRLGANSTVQDFVIVGVLPKGAADEAETVIGANAFIRSHTVIYAFNLIGEDFQTGHGALIREANRLGNRVSIGSHSVVEHHIQIGDDVRIHSNVFIPEFSILEDGCWIGPNVVFTNARYPLGKHAKQNLIGPHIHSGAKIGANSTLLPGVVIGKNAIVGAGSVVVRDVPEGKVVVGNPARVIGDVENLPEYRG